MLLFVCVGGIAEWESCCFFILYFFGLATIDEVETDVVEIEAKLDKLVKLCSGMLEAGKVYITTNKHFVSGVRDLSQQCRKDQMISECLDKFGDSLQEMMNYHMILFDQAQRSVRQQLHNFVKDDVRKFKETKKQFDKVREDMEISLVKNAQAPRHKPHEVEEATGTLSITRKCFRHLALDYVLQINVLQAKKKFEILDAMLSFMHAQFTFFQQGYSLLHELDPYMKKLATELDQLVIDSAVEKREMEHKHALIQQRSLSSPQDFSYDDSKVEFNVDAPNGVVMEGYLFKRASNAFKTWNRRWFSIQNSQLVYQKKLKDVLTVVVEDLRLCTVKPCEDIERRFCFEVVSPTKSCMLQADSEKLRQAWIQAVQASIASAYRESPDCFYIERLDRTASPSTSSIDSATDSRERGGKGEPILQRVQSIPGNEQCCDCGQPDPRWASINLGILLCIECSGIHRSLGVHCSKVRSLTLDSWEPELLKLMCELGNSTMNQIYEAQCEELGLKKPTAGSSRQDKEAWIKVKYVEKKFLKKLLGGETLAEAEAEPNSSPVAALRTEPATLPSTAALAAGLPEAIAALLPPLQCPEGFPSHWNTQKGSSPTGIPGRSSTDPCRWRWARGREGNKLQLLGAISQNPRSHCPRIPDPIVPESQAGSHPQDQGAHPTPPHPNQTTSSPHLLPVPPRDGEFASSGFPAGLHGGSSTCRNPPMCWGSSAALELPSSEEQQSFCGFLLFFLSQLQ
uniref:Arf-GAP with coiled-coil, ANK repeat and PH domain-containing protein n=1 Tax=Zonotrichia albicollis TaxID=44394 RepID=A0A8D2QKV1_ZONAL